MIQISVNDQTKYIAQLPQVTQDKIIAEVDRFIRSEQFEEEDYYWIKASLQGRVCDLEDTIEIYYTK